MSWQEAREWLEELRDNWDDPYWRVDHPEVMAVLVAVITGIIGLAFAVVQALIQRRLVDA